MSIDLASPFPLWQAISETARAQRQLLPFSYSNTHEESLLSTNKIATGTLFPSQQMATFFPQVYFLEEFGLSCPNAGR